MAGSSRGALRPHKCWIAWARDGETTGALLGADEDLWAMTDTALELFKLRVHIPRLDPDAPGTGDEAKECELVE